MQLRKTPHQVSADRVNILNICANEPKTAKQIAIAMGIETEGVRNHITFLTKHIPSLMIKTSKSTIGNREFLFMSQNIETYKPFEKAEKANLDKPDNIRDQVKKAIRTQSKSIRQLANEISVSRTHIKCLLTRLQVANEIECHQVFDESMGRAIGYYSLIIKNPHARKISFDTDEMISKLRAQDRETRLARKTAHNHIGISPIYAHI